MLRRLYWRDSIARSLYILFEIEGFKHTFLGEGKAVSDLSKAGREKLDLEVFVKKGFNAQP